MKETILETQQTVYERDGARVLKRIDLQPHHSPKSQTRHYLPSDNANAYPQFAALEIAKYDSDGGFYLFHVTVGGENADTYHSTMQEAMEQAEFEFGVKKEEWIDVSAQ